MLRRDRVHFTGGSNADTRTSPDSRPIRRLRAPLHESKYKTFEEKMSKPKASRLPLSPLKKAVNYYHITDRKCTLQEPITRPKAGLLSNASDAFMGGDTDPFLQSAYKKLNASLKRSNSVTEATLVKDKYYKSKEDEHKQATTETQLVHMLHSKTLEGKVDLKKVVDIRRAIRRRYANRTDMSKIFNAWDLGSLGVIRPEDVHQMVNRLGIELSLDEARVLVASATQSMADNLSLDDFMKLIFDDSDRLNVDLSLMGDITDHQVPGQLLKNLQELTANKQTQRLLNSLIFEVKQNISDVYASLIKGDRRKSGMVSFETFSDILHNMSLPHSFNNEKYWRMLYAEMGGTDAGLNYAHFHAQIIARDVSEDAKLNSLHHRAASVHETDHDRIKALVASKSIQPRSNSVLDKRRLPINILDKLMKNLIPLKAKIIKQFSSPSLLAAALRGLSDSPGISTEKLNSFLKSIDPQLSSTNAQLFFSAFIYNPQGLADIEDVVTQVFANEDLGNIELYRHPRALAPITKSKPIDDKANSSIWLKAIDQKLNWGSSSYEAFRRMDQDGDGFVSANDLKSTMQLMHFNVTEGETAALMKEIDSSNEGYLTFQKFARQMSTPLMEKSKDIWDIREASVQPSTAFLQSLHSYGSSKDFYETLRTSLKPKVEPLQKSNRFRATPAFKNTFVNFKSEVGSTLYANDLERMVRKTIEPINFNSDDTARWAKVHTANQLRISQMRQGSLGKGAADALQSQ